jgi:hypothetical protein
MFYFFGFFIKLNDSSKALIKNKNFHTQFLKPNRQTSLNKYLFKQIVFFFFLKYGLNEQNPDHRNCESTLELIEPNAFVEHADRTRSLREVAMCRVVKSRMYEISNLPN